MKVLVIEDEKLASERLIDLIKTIKPETEIVGTLRSVESGLEWFAENAHPDLVISDIQLLDGSSFEIFEKVKPKCQVIFTTAYDQYAIKAFDVNSVDYLLKPIQEEKLANAFQKLEELNESSNEPTLDLESIRSLINTQHKEYKSRFLTKVGQRIRAIPVEKIAYFYTSDKLTYIITFERQKFIIDSTLEEVDAMLNPKAFFRVNRKFLVHFDAVSDIHPYFKGRVKIVLQPEIDEDIVVSSEKTPLFKMWLDN
ncbi:MAG: DNA-binding LytR/AlgR family response regulator [Roseivirga sp.]|jgi:DNA-binding LytR/AlgR family response regulator